MEESKVKDFQDAILHNPTVHAYMSKYMNTDGANYISTLKAIIVALVNENESLKNKLVEWLNENGTPPLHSR